MPTFKEIKDTDIYKYLIEKGFRDDQFDSHESDLYILYESKEQSYIIETYMFERSDFKCYFNFSSVKGQSWYGKWFIEIPFYLM